MSVGEILLVASILPSILLMKMVYEQDRIEKEPKDLLGNLFLMGVLSAFIAAIVEGVFGAIVSKFIEPETGAYIFIEAFIIVALVEECAKYIMLKQFSWKDKNFNYTFDAIVYAVFVSLGFATIENIFYVLGNGLLVAIVRAIASVPGHMTFGVFMGIYYGRAKMCEKLNDINGRKYNLAMAVLVPTLLHGLFDYCLMKGTAPSIVIFLGILVFIYINMFVNLKKHSKSDKKIHLESETINSNQEENSVIK